jgi:hypothetical protein
MALLLKNILTSTHMAQVKPKTEYFAYEKMYCPPSTNSESTNPVLLKFFLANYTPRFFLKEKAIAKKQTRLSKKI